MSTDSIVIVGAGLAGSAAALSLLQAGFEVTLMDRKLPQPMASGDALRLRVSTLNLASIVMLERLGVWSEISAERAQPFSSIEFWQGDPTRSVRLDARSADLPRLGAVIENDWVCQHLHRAIERHEAGQLLDQCQVADLHQGRRQITVECADGTSISAQAVIAADGPLSDLRQTLGIEPVWHDYDQQGLVTVVHTETGSDQTAFQRFLADGPLAFLPLGNRRYSIVWSMPDAQAMRVRTMTDSQWLDALQKASQDRFGALSLMGERAHFPLRRMLVDRMVEGRCVLLGDAAHVIHPLAGQGANLGLQDAASLTQVLSEGGIDSTALRRYERWRQSDNQVMARSMDLLKASFAQKDNLIARARDGVLSLFADARLAHRPFITHAAGFGGQVPELMTLGRPGWLSR